MTQKQVLEYQTKYIERLAKNEESQIFKFSKYIFGVRYKVNRDHRICYFVNSKIDPSYRVSRDKEKIDNIFDGFPELVKSIRKWKFLDPTHDSKVGDLLGCIWKIQEPEDVRFFVVVKVTKRLVWVNRVKTIPGGKQWFTDFNIRSIPDMDDVDMTVNENTKVHRSNRGNIKIGKNKVASPYTIEYLYTNRS
jgi:hypothetical protein